ncbi:FtsX-like permease family protein [Parvibaculum sedimenti]|uniref:FtsX-like permease family protein n=2 Tax=Parvibaculum sedimenti TaxID=2608632 RepID=A0A6N6VMH1_9HYPH|nr:FtsX-like permease family protein [Parvibaculum sedimenti]KAB7742249.1 FtsX-like permease family protein [Parvibaculum sedimenti]
MNTLALAFRLARRELRANLAQGFAGFRIFLACLALGVAAIAGVGSVSTALTRGLAERGQEILGGDVDVRLIHREANAAELAFLSKGNVVSRSAELRAMARTVSNDKQSLVELKAVDGLYPLYGAMKLAPDMSLGRALALRDGRYGLVAEPNLVSRLGLKPGDTLRVGENLFELRAEIRHEPDRVGDGFALGPRVMIAEAALPATELVQPGSLVNYHYRLRLPEAMRDVPSIKAWVKSLDAAFPDAGWRVQDRTDSAPSMRRFVERVALFLTFVGLTALTVGGVGIANAVKSYLDGKREVIATFKCLGAPGSLIFAIYLVQVMALALAGIAVGLAIGAAVPFVTDRVVGDLIPVPAALGLYPGPLLLAAAYGLLTALAFAIWPLARAREVPAASLFRAIVAPERQLPKPLYIAVTAATLLALGVLAVVTAEQPLFALWFILGAAGVFALLRLAAAGVMGLAARLHGRSPEMRLALANLTRPGSPTPAVMLSLGLGLTLLVTVSLINGNLSSEIMKDIPGRAPSFFFVDIQPDQTDAFESFVRGTPGVTKFDSAPMLRGRIVALNGIVADKIKPASNAEWALKGDRGITYSGTPPANGKLISGKWWPADYKGPLLVSFADELAKGLGLKLGDKITVNVLGREIEATLANTREVDWQSLGINFVMIFSPGPLEAAPHTELATVTMDEAGEAALERDVVARFPNVTSVRVKEALDAVNTLLGQFSLAVRVTGLVTLAAGILVLAGAMAAGFRGRARDAVILKVLGATRARVLGIYMREYAALGFSTALVAALSGSVAAWAVVSLVMEMPWVPLWGTLALTILGATAATVGLGLLGTWRVLSVPAAGTLRAE